MVSSLAIGLIGYQLLAGRIELRRGAITILGCLILFGAPVIAASLFQIAVAASESPSMPPLQRSQPIIVPLPTASSPYDPYAGASVPTR